MELNANFDERVAVHAAKLDWVASPMPGVDRRMLDRIGGEVARATSIVRYAPESRFSQHVHTGGEEFLVLEGVFQDEHGDFPAGSYIRNPPQSAHTPGSDVGCVIFVKLWQFDMDDRTEVKLDTNTMAFEPVAGRSGVEVMALHADQFEEVCLERWAPNASVDLNAVDGMEVLVIEGAFDEGADTFAAHSWLRLPKGAQATAKTGPAGAKVWIKRGHLARTPQAPKA